MRKIRKNDPRTARRKGPTHIRPTSPVCASTGAGGLTDPQLGENPPGKPVSRPVCGRGRKEDGREQEKGAEGGKTPVFLPDSGRFPPDLL